ncbi:hypothetical protein PF005_g24054 [Phytophthora fragariae]|uniref:Uncharacterized protein n=1 Tax=Phytophthora fragariae TaxID=53985 RepID=A0A6A3W467_9STRA|nr:hypothetical protein PF003_g37309 [Phytophthora fragariae]KAE8924927.1 hypothetical protein PF009_g24849 [Phytophthora fragariae]KAE8979535.1 hypothetical protein PF011_g22809 [Phytophthora fragariae]KAE9077844.1 hypothetical protein PF007_g24094 [Phytophthora fragariae]KAE9079478.1 hypothetical protein PF010_g22739 [Phytophthora fragariae]
MEVTDEQEGGSDDEPAIPRPRPDNVVQFYEPAQRPEGSQSSSLVVERAPSSKQDPGDETLSTDAAAELVTAEVKLLADVRRVERTEKQELTKPAVQRLRVDAATIEQTPPTDTGAWWMP